MQDLLFALLLGIGPGAVFAILAVGLVVAYRGSGVINFSHGAIAMYTALTFNRIRTDPDLGGSGDIFLPWVDIIPEWGWLRALRLNNLPVRIGVGDTPMATAPAIIIAIGMAALIGLLAHVCVFRPLRYASPLSKVIGSVGVMIYLQAIAVLHFGTSQKSDQGWGPYKSGQEPIENALGLGNNLPRHGVWLLLTAAIAAILIWALIRFTRFGLASRAIDENERGMALLGYSSQAIAGSTWVLSAVLAGLVGVIFVAFTQPSNMTLFVVPALGGALVGNLTSTMGAALGGLGIAMLQSAGVRFTAYDWWPEWLPANGVRQVVPLLIVVFVLYRRGDRLPVRGTLVARGEPRAPVVRRPTRVVSIGLAFVAFIALVGNWRLESGLTTSLIAGIFMLSLVVLVGYQGQISLAQWTIAGLAAFVAMRLASDGNLQRGTDFFAKSGPDWPSPVAMLVAIAAATVAGVIIGLPALRIRGFQLAVISIAAVIAIEDLLLGNESLMGEGASSTNPVPVPRWFGTYVGGQRRLETENGILAGTPDNPAFTVLVAVIAALMLLGVSNLRSGHVGRKFLAVRANERAAAAAGIDVTRSKLLGFAISSAIAGVAGVLFTYQLPAVTTQQFGLFSGLGLLAFVYIAGITSVVGAFVGGVLVSGGLLAALSSSDPSSGLFRYTPLIGAFGLLAAALMANGEGVLRLSDRFKRWRTHWNDRETEVATWGPAGRVPVLVLGGIAMADFVARGVVPIALEDIQDDFGFSDFQAGFIPFADVLAGAAIVVFAGWLADRVKRTRLLGFLLVLWAIATALTGAIQRFAHLFTLRVLLGMMTSVDDPSSSSLLSDFYPARIRHRAFSWRLVAPILGGAFGNLLAGIVIDQAGWRWAFLVGGAPAAILVWFVLRLPEPVRGQADLIDADDPSTEQIAPSTGAEAAATDALLSEDDAEQVPWGEALRSMGRRRSLVLMVAASALSFGPAVGVTFWAPTFLRRHHDLSAGEAAGLFGFAALSGALLGAWVASRGPDLLMKPATLSDEEIEEGATPTVGDRLLAPIRNRWGGPSANIRHLKLLIAGVGSTFGVLLLILAYSPTPVSLKFPFLLFGAAGLVAAGPILAALISEVTPPRIRGSVFSINSFCRLALSALTPLVIGYIADQVTFVDRNVPVAIVADEAVEDRADRYECTDEGRVLLGDNADDDDRPGIKNYECGDEEVGHLGAGMVAMLVVGGLSGPAALMARRNLEEDIAAVSAEDPVATA